MDELNLLYPESPDSPVLHKDETLLNPDSNAFQAQNTFRGIIEQEYMVSMTIRSDRNEDTMRPMRGTT